MKVHYVTWMINSILFHGIDWNYISAINDLDHRWARVFGWGGGAHPRGGSKNLPAAFGGRNFFRRPFHQGVILLNRNEKKCSPQGSICPNFFSPWGYQGGGVDLFHLGCRPQKVFYPGVHPPTPPPRAHLCLYSVQIL